MTGRCAAAPLATSCAVARGVWSRAGGGGAPPGERNAQRVLAPKRRARETRLRAARARQQLPMAAGRQSMPPQQSTGAHREEGGRGCRCAEFADPLHHRAACRALHSLVGGSGLHQGGGHCGQKASQLRRSVANLRPRARVHRCGKLAYRSKTGTGLWHAAPCGAAVLQLPGSRIRPARRRQRQRATQNAQVGTGQQVRQLVLLCMTMWCATAGQGMHSEAQAPRAAQQRGTPALQACAVQSHRNATSLGGGWSAGVSPAGAGQATLCARRAGRWPGSMHCMATVPPHPGVSRAGVPCTAHQPPLWDPATAAPID